jgi:hypothetical protein
MQKQAAKKKKKLYSSRFEHELSKMAGRFASVKTHTEFPVKTTGSKTEKLHATLVEQNVENSRSVARTSDKSCRTLRSPFPWPPCPPFPSPLLEGERKKTGRK